MRLGLIVAGLIIAGLGIAATMGKFQYNHTKEVVKLGDLSLKAQEQDTVPQWAGIVGIVVGGALFAGGLLKK